MDPLLKFFIQSEIEVLVLERKQPENKVVSKQYSTFCLGFGALIERESAFFGFS